ncbi:MAG: glycine cleavage system protein H [Ignavibacteria bacterium RIFOXYB2_FULL_35_12]|nr:MAG: glycine cleavage system protein H [Ignavibacteria bacterium GWA2_36_19]OGU61501.1 MAG: glycine cleavage system protein H [Ignavibacteria bacterium GWF2_35_20]OGU78562.1 MAG: glycine cleavage system protein H [Ignavibacteria bacterium RIFOXYA2_FULL_35_9]OGU85533.1 MAG: glycine cleavage system protein H [Ignavibacteria bacterium RIFOXYA12_FULL_35_25]OGU90302.1 MAG: glycine cleavage system protein H [Ignavibacteria bacterium RIFOXYC12_FULL_35_11]OGU96738.1 MAG: glycine cleavage system pro
MKIPENLRYTKDHEWILIEGKTGTIGITDYAQGELGDVVFIDIDPNLKEIKRGQSFGAIEAVKTVSDLYAPCNGKVLEINSALANSPEIVNSDPYGGGWMVKIEIKDLDELEDLLNSKAYSQMLGK